LNPATWRYTPNVAGTYLFSSVQFPGAAAAAFGGLVISKNGVYTAGGMTPGGIFLTFVQSYGLYVLDQSTVAAMNGTTDYVTISGLTPNATFGATTRLLVATRLAG
jgi:hypothetical protein